MKTFTINAENKITVHASRKAACETDAGVFSTAEQFADSIGPDNKRLVEIWNRIPGTTSVKRFKNRQTAIERIWKAIQILPVGTAAAGGNQPGVPLLSEAPQDTDTVPVMVATEIPCPDTELALSQTETETEAARVAGVAPHVPDVALPEAPAKIKTARAKRAPQAAPRLTGSRGSSKTETILALLKQPGGTTLQAIMQATEWQSHSVRGFISGTVGKKMKLTVVSIKTSDGERSYSIKV